jgi:Zn-dependent peptidase ImmA (M78 family)/DNA-binding XRE family transcriptional regulator
MVAIYWWKIIVIVIVSMSNKQLELCADGMPLGITQMAKSNLFSINTEMLALAREAMGLTQKDLADQIGCRQSRLSKIEAGELVPHENDIQSFIRVLGQARDFFFQQGTATPSSVSFYRKTQTLPLKMLRQCNAQMNVRRLQIERQIGQVKMGKRDLPRLSPENNGGAKAVAQKLRQEWGIDRGAIQKLTKLVEDTGCVIVDYSFPSAKLDGLCIRAEQKTPIIFLNKDLPKSRRRLSLAHEVGHLVMHVNPHEAVEDEAWEFAEEFLMPVAEIEQQLDGLNLDKLGQLKKEWGVSMQAILYRAKKLGKISESYYRFLWMQIGKCGYRINEPFEDVIPDETATELETRLKTNI